MIHIPNIQLELPRPADRIAAVTLCPTRYSRPHLMPPTSIGSSSLVTATGCFSYPNLINDRRQTNRAAASATELPDTSVSPTEYWALESCWGASSQNGLQMARANVLLYSLASSMIRVSGAIGKSLIVLKHKPNNHNFFKTGFVASVF